MKVISQTTNFHLNNVIKKGYQRWKTRMDHIEIQAGNAK